jgi:hypothetical protein
MAGQVTSMLVIARQLLVVPSQQVLRRDIVKAAGFQVIAGPRHAQRRPSRICWLCGVGLHSRALKSPSTD